MSSRKRGGQRAAGPSAVSTDTISGENALEFLFNYRPKFVKLKNFEGSNGTRDPSPYDMHLHPQLILKDIILFPDMLKQLAGVVDSKPSHLTRGNGSLPRVAINGPLDPEQVSSRMKDSTGITIGPEADLQGEYGKLQKLTAVVASTLFAGLKKWSTIFKYNSKPISMAPCALADGYLSLDEKAIKEARLPKELDSELKLVIKHNLSDFLLVELKSMNAGSEAVFRAIGDLVGSEFSWVRCPKSQRCGASFCRKPGNRFQFSITGHKTGEDGDIMEDEPGASTGDPFRFNKSSIDFSVAPVPDTRAWKFRRGRENAQKKSGVRRRSDDGPDEEDGETGGGDIDGDSAEEGVTLPYTQEDFDKAKKIIQQIWAEAVNVDSTFIVLNAGSREYIGIRDRKLQRLYLSPFIDLDKPDTVLRPGYFKIHTGLQITALVDAIQRAKKLHASRGILELYTFQYDRGEPYQDKASNAAKTARISSSTKTPRDAQTEASSSANADEDDFSGGILGFLPAESQLLQQLQDACTLKISWDAYIFDLGPAGSMTVTRSVEGVPSYGGTQMELHVVHHYPQSAHSYACYAADGDTTLPGIVIKVAPPGRAKEALMHEHKMYNVLWRIKGVAQSLGLVDHLGLYCEEYEEKTILVLLDGGERMTTKCRMGTFDNVYTQVKEAVRTMHFAKITHGHLTPENILVTKDQHTKKGEWKIHFISWKDGKYHGYFSARKVSSNATLDRSTRRGPPLKAKPRTLAGKGNGGQEQHGTDGDSSRMRRLKPQVLKLGVKNASRIFLTARVHLQQFHDEFENDRKMLDSGEWGTRKTINRI